MNMKINYTVKVPVTNSVDFNNDYGSITLDKIKGNAKIKLRLWSNYYRRTIRR